MTAPELLTLADKHGFEVVFDGDQPSLRPLTDEAVLPGPVRYTFKKFRQAIIDWHRRENRPAVSTCRLCLAMVHSDSPVWESRDPVFCVKGKCPFKPPREA